MSAKFVSALVFATALAAAGGYFLAVKRVAPVAASPAGPARKIAFYQSPMHPWIKSDKPGKCTICGMNLVPVYEGDSGRSVDKNVVTLSASSAGVIGVKTSEVRRGVLTRTLRVTGVLDDDETKHRVVSAHVPGRIEKLFVDQVGREVKAGEPLALLYSPEIQTAERQYVELYRSGPNAFTASERADARERLLAMGMLPEEIADLEKTLDPQANIQVLAHGGGTVISRLAYAGQYVKTHDALFEVGDFSTLWFVFDAHEADLASLEVGQTVAVSTPTLPGETIPAPIAFIDPNLDEKTRTARVRVVLDNADGRLRHRQTASGDIRIETADTLLVPRAAVLHTRAAPVVFVDKGGGAYEKRTVKLGRAGDEAYEVISGLQNGERVVTNGALLIDSQAQLAHGAEEPAMPSAGDHAAEPANGPAKAAANTAEFEPVALAAADASAALAGDDLASIRKTVTELQVAVKEAHGISDEVRALGAKLVTGPDAKSARRAFEPLSTALADLARGAHLHEHGLVKIFQCPMSPVLGTGRWLQRDAPLHNPFFGPAMPDCGEEIK